jgi:hypothetical protein
MSYFLKGTGKAYGIEKDPTGTPIATPFLEIKDMEISVTSNEVEQTGGDNTFALDSFTTSMTGTIKITNAKILSGMLEFIGMTKLLAQTVNVLYQETQATSGSTAITTSQTYASGTVKCYDSDTKQPIAVTENGTTSITLESAPTDVDLVYEVSVTADTYTYTSSSAPIYLEIFHTSTNPNNSKWQEVRVYKAKVDGSFTLLKAGENQYTSPDINLKILDPQRGDQKVIGVTIYDPLD